MGGSLSLLRHRFSAATIRAIPYGSSLLPSSLLSRLLGRTGVWRAPATLLCLIFYGLDVDLRRMLRTLRLYPRVRFTGQMLQDLWVISLLGSAEGFFVDVGASHPVKYSNTWALQKSFGWTGLLIDANPSLVKQLEQLRRSEDVAVVGIAISTSSREQVRLLDAGPMSSLEETTYQDHLGKRRAKIAESADPVFVSTASLSTVLDSIGAPRKIDYLSIDVEGADFDALSSLDFTRWSVSLISIEHNLNLASLHKIEMFLTAIGYRRVLRRWSSIDAWFIHQDAAINRNSRQTFVVA